MTDDEQPPAYECSGPEHHTWLDPDDAAKCCNGYVRERRIVRTEHGARLEFYWRPAGPEGGGLRSVRGVALRQGENAEGGGVAHAAFFERLAQFTDSHSPEWKSICAGLLTLRLIDRFATSPERAREPTVREFHWVRSAVDEIETGRMQDVLRELLDGAQSGDVTTRSICALLFAYAWQLEDAAEWEIAADVYATVIEQADYLGEPGARPRSYNRLGYCRRQVGDLRAAVRAFRHGRKAARRLGDMPAELRIRVSEANLAIHRGNLPLACTMLDEIIDEARARGYQEPLAMALHDRGGLACDREQYADAVPYLFEALQTYADSPHQQRALADLARALSALGCRDAARDALTVVFESADDRDCRWGAAINLLEMASLDGDDAAFAHYQRLIDGEPLPAQKTASYLLRVAEAHQRAGRAAESERSYRALLAHAAHHGLNEYTFMAEAGLAGQRPLTAAPAGTDLAPFAAVAASLRSRRQALANVTR